MLRDKTLIEADRTLPFPAHLHPSLIYPYQLFVYRRPRPHSSSGWWDLEGMYDSVDEAVSYASRLRLDVRRTSRKRFLQEYSHLCIVDTTRETWVLEPTRLDIG